MNFGFKRRHNHPGKPKVLPGKDIPSLAEYIKSKNCVSTSAGIPDFRSPETGKLNLPHPEAVFEINFFRKNPVPFYTLAHELYPGKFRPTITHSFIRLLAEKSLLHTCFTQNIDTLERRAGVPGEKIIEAHGSFATQRCIVCRRPFDDEKMKEHIDQKKIAKCEVCGGYVKPDIVFFGEDLPPNFIHSIPNLRKADLLIVMGTSLTVHPFASLAGMVDDSCPRVLINLDLVGDFGSRADDVILLGKCDDIVKDLCKELGWEEELIRLWNETEDSVIPGAQESTEKPDELVEIEKELAELTLDANESVAASAEKAGTTTKDSEDKASASVHPASPSDSPPAATTKHAPKGEPEATPLKSEDAAPAKQQEAETPPADNKL
ncbi:DHS-like NAD/FAD-binding domain-containing protein [Flammula alnicola]|nr:DHS-like NAD/FAD-binding domain-containing protein [Flammula alnicola]